MPKSLRKKAVEILKGQPTVSTRYFSNKKRLFLTISYGTDKVAFTIDNVLKVAPRVYKVKGMVEKLDLTMKQGQLNEVGKVKLLSAIKTKVIKPRRYAPKKKTILQTTTPNKQTYSDVIKQTTDLLQKLSESLNQLYAFHNVQTRQTLIHIDRDSVKILGIGDDK